MQGFSHPASIYGLLLALLAPLLLGLAWAGEGKGPPATGDARAMNNQRLDSIIRRIDRQAQSGNGYWQFTAADTPVIVITDENADRMRIMAAVAKTDELEDGMLRRLMQANFDSALDARYAIAQGTLWSVFIHPLSPLQDREFLEGLGQVVNLKHSFGSSFSSGSLIFRGGDSEGLQRRELIDSLIERGLAI